MLRFCQSISHNCTYRYDLMQSAHGEKERRCTNRNEDKGIKCEMRNNTQNGKVFQLPYFISSDHLIRAQNQSKAASSEFALLVAARRWLFFVKLHNTSINEQFREQIWLKIDKAVQPMQCISKFSGIARGSSLLTPENPPKTFDVTFSRDFPEAGG